MKTLEHLVTTLKRVLPAEADYVIDDLARAIVASTQDNGSGLEHKVSISLGENSQIGDISIRDIAGRDMVTITNNFLDAGRKIDPNEIKVTLEEGVSKLSTPILLLDERTRLVTAEMNNFSSRIASINAKLLASESLRSNLDETTKLEIRYAVEALANDILMYGMSLDEVLYKHQSAMGICEVVIQRFIRQDLLDYKPPASGLLPLYTEILQIEKKLIIMRSSVQNALNELEKLISPQRVFHKSNLSIEICKRKLFKLFELSQDNLQLMWRAAGTIEGYTRTTERYT